MSKEVKLAESCASCFFREEQKFCHRHAPGVTEYEFEIAIWPTTDNADWCISGAENDEEMQETKGHCVDCVAWDYGEGGLKPHYLHGKTREWWENAGLCRRFSPSPSASERDPTKWYVTHKMSRCGDLRRPEPQEDELT